MGNKMTKWFYLQPFLFTRKSLHLLDISRKLNENHATVRKYLNQFAKEGFLKVSNQGRLTLYEINFEFPLVIDYLAVAEKEFLLFKCSQNKIFKELVSDLHNLSNKMLLVFGSSVENLSKAKDLDIICFESLDFREIEKKYDKEIHDLKVNSLVDIKDALKKEVLKKHIIVNSVEEVIKWLV
jgi:hypothetical protein